MKFQIQFAVLALLFAAVQPHFSTARAQGSLTPPGAPGATMRSLAQIEPRTPISTAPFTISNAGSYYFASNLTAVSGFATVTITTNDVAIDLCGFSLIGVTGSQEGFRLGTASNITIINGTIRKCGNYGINAQSATDCTFQNLRILDNGNIGIYADTTTTLKDCLIEGNPSYGVIVGDNSLVTGCTVRTNANGIGLGNGCVVTGCSSMNNTGYGFYAYSGMTMENCSARGNSSIGIVVGDSSVVKGCSASLNGNYGIWVTSGTGAGGSTVTGCTATGNQADGIDVTGYGNSIIGNTCSYNGPSGSTNYSGLRIDSSQNRVEDNNLAGNQNRGLRVTFGGNFIVRNTATANAVDFDITGTQTIGPIVTATGTITTNSPWANFGF